MQWIAASNGKRLERHGVREKGSNAGMNAIIWALRSGPHASKCPYMDIHGLRGILGSHLSSFYRDTYTLQDFRTGW